jgi:pteridine reductase
VNFANTQATKVALVTGGARRIGLSIVNKLHTLGYRVAIHYNSSFDDANELASKLNATIANSAMPFAAQLKECVQCEHLIKQVVQWAGRLDVLINNASLFFPSKMGEVDNQHWDNLFATNLKAPYFLSQYAYPYLKKHKGNIINISDIHASKPLKDYSVYCMSKAALVMQTKALAVELGPDIRVNAIAPGAIMWPESVNALTDDKKQAIIDKTPQKQHGSPDYIAQSVVFILKNPFINGQNIAVDGGRSIV